MVENPRYQYLTNHFGDGSGNILNDLDPASSVLLARFRSMTAEDVARKIELATDAFNEWSSVPSPKRGEILLKAGEIMEYERDAIAGLMTDEEGKTLRDSIIEVTRSAQTLKFYGALAFKYGGATFPSADKDTRIMTIRKPLGTVALITPWNFPLSIPVWKAAPALAAGNTVIIKPASKTPLMVAKLKDILVRAGMPDGAFNIVVGSGSSVGSTIVSSRLISAVSFTGSVPVGREIYKAAGEKPSMMRVQLELGGKNAMYVDESSDIARATEFTIRSAFGLTGQSCTATSRLLVHKDIYEKLKAAILSKLSTWKVGSGINPETNMGPVVDKVQMSTDLKYIKYGQEDGARLIFGGKILDHELFLQPALFENVTEDMRIFREEIFGPVLGMTEVKDTDEAIELCNSVPYGHTAGIISNNNISINRFVEGVEAGVVKVNKPTVGLELQAPFGAFKESGANTWKEMGEGALDFYTKEKTVYWGW